MKTKNKSYKYEVGYLHGSKIKRMDFDAESIDHARMIFENYIENMQAFTESGSKIFTILSIRQKQ